MKDYLKAQLHPVQGLEMGNTELRDEDAQVAKAEEQGNKERLPLTEKEDGQIFQPTPSDSDLKRLLEEARYRRMTPHEVLEQRISFAAGNLAMHTGESVESIKARMIEKPEEIVNEERPPLTEFERKLKTLLNIHSMESASGTPDFILAEYMVAALNAYSRATRARELCHRRVL
jgi:hypothetical protein